MELNLIMFFGTTHMRCSALFLNMQKRLVPGGLNQNRYLIGNAYTYIFFKLLELLAIKDA